MVGLHLLHGVGRQVVEHHLVVALEEVLAVEQQFVDLLAMHQNATVVLQLHAVHLTDEGIEHGAVGNVEGIGIEGDGVAAIEHFHAGFLDYHFAEG